MTLTETEYQTLRQTIASRGTARMVLVPATLFGWAVLALAILTLDGLPVATLISLAVLIGGFESVHALHVGTERIGRYLQVYYEAQPDGPRWETTAMAVGPGLPGGGIDPLFTFVFAGATFINLIAALIPSPTRLELGVTGVLHILFIIRVVRARGAAARQRAVELETFRAIQSQSAAKANPPVANS